MSEGGVKGKQHRAPPAGSHTSQRLGPDKTVQKNKSHAPQQTTPTSKQSWNPLKDLQQVKREVEEQQKRHATTPWSSAEDQKVLHSNVLERYGYSFAHDKWRKPGSGGWVSKDAGPGHEKRNAYLNLDEKRTELANEIRWLQAGEHAPVDLHDPVANHLARQTTLKNLTEDQRGILARAIHREANKAGLDPNVVASVIHNESTFTFDITSPKGAKGLMQLTKIAVAQININREKRDKHAPRYSFEDVKANPLINIEYGVEYLKYLRGRFAGNDDLMLMAYNQGDGRTKKWLAGHNLKVPDIESVKDPSKKAELAQKFAKEVRAAMDLDRKRPAVAYAKDVEINSREIQDGKKLS